MLRNAIKLLAFIGLVSAFSYFASGGSELHAYWVIGRVEGIFTAGAVLAIWGDMKVGTLDPISLRGAFVVLGVLLMILAVVLAYGLRGPPA